MDISKALLKDKLHKKEQALIITDYACSTPENFKELMQCFLSNEYRLAQRAAWSISWAAQKKPHFIKLYIKDLIEQLSRKAVHDAVIRNSVCILQKIDIPKDLHGELMNCCFAFIESNKTPVAVKAFSLTTLFNLSKIYPDIKNELKIIIEERLDDETAAFKQRGKQILRHLNT